MSYLQFEKTLLTNLQEALPKEILRTNRSGAYSSSSIVDCNTRKYHGLLVVPVPEIDDNTHVLLSSLDETVIQHGAEFNLGLHKYAGDVYSPNGHKYLREFTWDKIPTTVYRVGGVILRKEKVFQHFHNRILIRYTLVDAHSVTTLRLRPFLAFRAANQLTHENSAVNRNYEEVDNGIKTCMYDGYPYLYMQTNKKAEYVFTPNWYKGIEYPKDQELGYDYSEDLYVPGYFEFNIKKGESVIFSAGLEEINTRTLKKTFDEEIEVHTSRDSFHHCLINAAHQFHNKKKGEHYILAGYPWFKARARDTFVSLPGLTLANDETERFISAMATAEKAINDFTAGKPISVKIYEMEAPDVLLWAVWCIQQYARMVDMNDAVKRYGALVRKIVSYILQGKHPNLELHDNGMLYTNGKEHPATWMNSTINGRPVVPRTGYIVEICALWYNALIFGAQILEAEQKQDEEEKCKEIANEGGKTFRENTPLTQAERKSVFDICTKELRTPKGIRSLSPKSGAYNPIYQGGQQERDAAYHQGTVWPFMLGFYLETCMKVYKRSGLSFVDRSLIGLEEEMLYHGIGTLPELFDGNPPFHGRGALSFAMNVAAILRVNKLLSKYYNY